MTQYIKTSNADVKPEPKPAPVIPPPPNPKELVRLVGVIENGEIKSAIFYDSLSGKQKSMNERDSLHEMGVSSQIVEIRRNSILIKESNSLRELSLGARLKEAVEIN